MDKMEKQHYLSLQLQRWQSHFLVLCHHMQSFLYCTFKCQGWYWWSFTWPHREMALNSTLCSPIRHLFVFLRVGKKKSCEMQLRVWISVGGIKGHLQSCLSDILSREIWQRAYYWLSMHKLCLTLINIMSLRYKHLLELMGLQTKHLTLFALEWTAGRPLGAPNLFFICPHN